MMQVGIVRMAVLQPLVAVRMAVRLLAVPDKVVRMPVMLVVYVAMCMRHRFMRMRMLVAFRKVQPYPERHERARDP